MAQQAVDFSLTGDDTTAALKKHDNNINDHEVRIAAAMPKSGGAFTGSISSPGNITSTGGDLVTVQAVRSSTVNMIVATNSAGTIYFRPNGVNSTGGECTINNVGSLTLAYLMRCSGIQCRAGLNGGYGANNYNMMWTGSAMQLWVDATNLGTVSTSSSDYRIKDDVRGIEGSDLDRVMRWRPVTWLYRDIEGTAWKSDGRRRRSFIAHELQAVDETLVSGAKDAVDEDGNIVPQQLEPLALISQLAGAVQELKHELDATRARVAELEAR